MDKLNKNNHESLDSYKERISEQFRILRLITDKILSKLNWNSDESKQCLTREKSFKVDDRTYEVSQTTAMGSAPEDFSFNARKGNSSLSICFDKADTARLTQLSYDPINKSICEAISISDYLTDDPEVAYALLKKVELFIADLCGTGQDVIDPDLKKEIYNIREKFKKIAFIESL